MGEHLERVVRLSRPSQVIRVGNYHRKDGTQVSSYTRLGVKGARTFSVRADSLEKGDFVADGGQVKRVESAISVLETTALSLRDGEGRISQKRFKRSARIQKVLLGILAVAISLGVAGGVLHSVQAEHHHQPNPVTKTFGGGDDGDGPGPKPHPPEPTTAAGYAKMFSTVPTSQWGAADVAYSTPLPDGRHVWLYGDTLSTGNGFVHSTAITQDGGTLHVSDGGKQLLPNGPTQNGRQTIYWISNAHATGKNTIDIVAAPVSIGKKSAWDFHRAGHEDTSRVAKAHVDDAGNVHFDGWKGWVKRPNLTYDDVGPNDMKVLGPHHFTYQHTVHTDIVLGNGKHLVTEAQNWDDSPDNHKNSDGSFRFSDFQPIFSAE